MKRATLVLTVFMAAGCSSDHEDLRQWMAENTKDMRPSIAKLPPAQPYEPVPYSVNDLLDPFKSAKIEPDSKRGAGAGKGGLQPDFEARKLRNSVLEKYPLESLRMIGYLNVNKQPMAVIQADTNVKQIKIGEYIGLDFGVVTQISDKEVKLRELIQDAAGDWSERESSLYLQAKEGSKK